MSLKNALMGFKKQLEDKATDEKIAKMLAEQKDLISNTKVKEKKWWDESILVEGGSSHYKFNDKWYRLSVDSNNDVEYTKFKYHIRTSLDNRLYISAKSYKEAQDVVDDMFGKNMYLVSGSIV